MDAGDFYCWNERQLTAQPFNNNTGIPECSSREDQVQLLVTDVLLIQFVARKSWNGKDSSQRVHYILPM